MSESLSLDPAQRQRLQAISPSHDTRDLTIVFTDLVGFTALRTRVGEHRGLEILGAHQTMVRQLLEDFSDAREIKTMGDAFLLAFARPSDAVAFSLRVLMADRAARAKNMPDLPGLRIGVHSGEVAVLKGTGGIEETDIFGLQVDITKRVQDLAAGGQILMTCFVFDNARTRIRAQDFPGIGEIRWERHGFHRLKGLDHPIEICEVGEIEHAPFTAPAGAAPVERIESDAIEGWRPGLGVAVPATNWRLESRLGVGGFGEVWLAHDRTHAARRTVFKFCTRRSKVKSLQRELHVFNTLTGESGRTPPGIVEVRGTHDTEAPYYIELEYLAGGDLRRWIEAHGKTAPLRTRLSLANQMTRALTLVHRSGFVHRDIKPSNFLLEESEDPARAPTLKLSDFGIGQAAVDDLIDEFRLTMALHSATLSQAAGTYLYIAPELIRPSSTEPSSGEVRAQIQKRAQPSADVYGLGVALYQLFAGSIDAIPGPGLRAVEDPVLREDVAACLDEDPDQRPTADELTDRLARYDERLNALIEEERNRLEQERQQALALAAALEAKRKAGRRTLIVMSGALVVAVILGAISMTQRQAAVSARDVALKATARAESARNDAVKATTRAQTARNDAEDLIEFMLTDLQARLEPIGRLEILGSVADEVLSYYDEMDVDEQSAESVRNRIHALINVGKIFVDEGDKGKAANRIDEAIEIVNRRLEQEPDNPIWLGALADALEAKSDTSINNREAVELLKRDIELRQRLVESNPDDSSLQYDLVIALRNLSFHLRNLQSKHEALDAANRGLSIAERFYQHDPQNAKWLEITSMMKAYVAFVSPPEESEKLNREALILCQKLVELYPDNANYKATLGWRLNAMTGYSQGEEAIKHARMTENLFRELSEQDPLNVGWRAAYVGAAVRHGWRLNAAGRYGSAVEVLKGCLQSGMRIVEMEPDNLNVWKDLAKCKRYLSEALHHLGRYDEEMEVLKDGIGTFESNVASHPEDQDRRKLLLDLYNQLDNSVRRLKGNDVAIKVFLSSLDTQERLADQMHNKTDMLRSLASRKDWMAHYLATVDQTDQAIDLHRSFAKTLSRLAHNVDNDPNAIRRITMTLVNAGKEQQEFGDQEGAREIWKRAAKVLDLVPRENDGDSSDDVLDSLDTRLRVLLAVENLKEARSVLEDLLKRLSAGELQGISQKLNPIQRKFFFASWSHRLFDTGRELKQLGDAESARLLWEQTLEITEPITQEGQFGSEPGDDDILETHIRILLALGKVQEAKPHLQNLLTQATDQRVALNSKVMNADQAMRFRNNWSWRLLQMGKTLNDIGEAEDARIFWGRAAELLEPVTSTAEIGETPTYVLDTKAQILLTMGRVDEVRPIVGELQERDWHNKEFEELCREHGLLPTSASPKGKTQ